MKKTILIAISFLIFIIANAQFYYTTTIININGVQLHALEAITMAQKIQGLSGRKSLTENQAMLFVYPEENSLSFWMKDMLFPIDMMWLNKKCQVIYIVAAAPPCAPNTDCAIYTPGLPAQYVLETMAGFAKKHAVELGSTINLSACHD